MTLKSAEEDYGNSFIGNLRLMLGYGIPLYLSSMLLLVGSQLQNILLAYFVSTAQIGNFRAAVNLTSLLTVVVTPILTTLFPAFSKLKPESVELKSFFNLLVKYVSLLIIPLSVAVIILSPDLVHAVYGAGYQQASLYLAVYATLSHGAGHDMGI